MVGRAPADESLSTAGTVIPRSPGVYILGEKLATLGLTLEKHGLNVLRTSPMLNFQRRQLPPDGRAMLQSLPDGRPQLVWIQYANALQDPNRRPKVRTALSFMAGIVKIQMALGGQVLL